MSLPGPTGLKGIGHAFVLNLDRRPDRLESFLARSRKAGLEGIERVAAVDGRSLLPSPEIRHLFRGNDFGYRRGVLGCALSHYRLWRRIADPAWPHRLTAVFEDDAVFRRGLRRLWNDEMADLLPDDCDLLYWGGPCYPVDLVDLLFQPDAPDPGRCSYLESEVNRHFVRPGGRHFCTMGYVLAAAAAGTLCRLAETQGIRNAIDCFLHDHWPRLHVYAALPLLCWSTSGEDSDIQGRKEALSWGS